MGDIGGTAQAGASVIDTSMTDATNVLLQKQAQNFNANQADLQRTWSAQQAQNQMNFNAQQAQDTRQFQAGQQLQAEQYNTQMSDTAMQRRVQDLQAANLNPLLAISQGAASTPQMSAPSGATASAGLPSGASALSPAPAQVSGVMQNMAQLRLANAQAANTDQNTKLQIQQARSTEYTADQLEVDTSQQMLMKRAEYLANTYQMSTDQAAIVAQTRNLVVAQTTGQDLKNTNQMIQNNISRLDYQGQQALFNEMIATQTAIMRQQGTEATNITSLERGEQSPYGKAATALTYLQALHQPISSAVGTAQRLQNMAGD